jgi:hypothetical protein
MGRAGGCFFALRLREVFSHLGGPQGQKEAFMRTALKIHEEPVRANMGQVEILEMFGIFFFSVKFSPRPSGKVFLLHMMKVEQIWKALK